MLLLATVGEVWLRITNPPPPPPVIPPPYNTAQKDDLLGWKMTPDYQFEGTLRDQAGLEYPVKIHYDERGFKTFGNPDSNRPKVFFVGDSYTASVEVSNEKSFFNLLADSLGIEVFAYGHAGFSNLQEYMILDQWLDEIRPDLIVWETCSNDFIDNYAALEIECGYKVGERRPYLNKRGKLVYKTPVSFYQKWKKRLLVLTWFDERWENLLHYGQEIRPGEYYISTLKEEYRPFREAVQTTKMIFEKARKRIPEDLPVVFFSADSYEPQMSAMRDIVKAAGFSYEQEPVLLHQEAESNRINIRAIDGYHWNELGHRLVAKGLQERIRAALTLPDKPGLSSKQ